MKTPILPGSFELVAIRADGTLNRPEILVSPNDQRTCQAMTELYRTLGFRPPWIGYVSVVRDTIVGGGAFVGPPADGRVEIAYYTADEAQRKGYATMTAQLLIQVAREAAPGVEICAKTEPRANASTRILTGQGFTLVGSTTDHEIGEAWLWRLEP